MKKVILVIVSLLSLLSIVGCEAEAKSSDFLSDEDLERLLGIDTIIEDELGLLDPPQYIIEIDGDNFIATNQIASLEGSTLEINFVSEEGNFLTIRLDNPASQTYTAGVASINLFELEYQVGDGDSTFFTSQTFTDDGFGALGLVYDGSTVSSNLFNFIAVSSDGTIAEGVAGEFEDVEVLN